MELHETENHNQPDSAYASDSISIIPAAELADYMEQRAIPYLTGISTTGYLALPEDSKSKGIYYEYYRAKDAKGAVVICHGFSESAEKYKEVIYYMVSVGYSVFIIDHRGHGRSIRVTAHPNKIHVAHFSDYVSDLHLLIEKIVKPRAVGLPLYLFAHSMGGAIGTLYLETYPDNFKKAVLSSPMLRINTGIFPETAALMIAHSMVRRGNGEAYGLGQNDFIPGERFEDSASSCEERFRYYSQKREATPQFQVSGSSYNWIYEAIRADKFMRSEKACAKIKIPVLVFQCMNDGSVDARGISEFVAHAPSTTLVQMTDCKHEIYNSSDSVLKDYYRQLFQFLCN